MNVYFDTSALVPMVVAEETTRATTGLWHEADRVVSSRLAYVEARAALAAAWRAGRLDQSMLRGAVRGLRPLMTRLVHVEVTPDLVSRAGELAETLSLRGYDAVHLASAEVMAGPDLVLATSDHQLQSAALTLGFALADLTSATG